MLIPYHFDKNLSEKCKVIGNVEWREYYGETRLFESNFNSAYTENLSDLSGVRPDIVMSHPECGAYSALKFGGKEVEFDGKESDIDDAYSKILESSPLLFSMDNLHKSLITFGTDYIKDKMKDYDIFFEPVSNYHYGNSQKSRKRFFIIGARKELGFVFVPGEKVNSKTIETVIGDLPEYDLPEIEHIHYKDEIIYSFQVNSESELIMSGGTPLSFNRLAEILKLLPAGGSIPYKARDGQMKKRIGITVNKKNYPSNTLFSGGGNGSPSLFHPYTFLPLTLRERARIQGFPDSFSLSMPHIDKSIKKFFMGNKVTGKSMPVEFSRFTANQFVDFLDGREMETSGDRLYVNIPDIITKNKIQYCQDVGYTNQEKACEHCWVKDYCPVRPSPIFSFFT